MDESRLIVVTGATKGLGRALVDRFAEAGHRVAGCGRSQEHIDELQSQFDGSHKFQVVDVAIDAEVAKWAEEVCDQLGVPCLLVNNAATINPNADLWEVPVDQFDTVIDVNIKGVANVIRHFVPRMVEQRRGIIVNISSGWGRSTSPEVAPYCATKWAIEGLTKAMAQELPVGMAAVPLNPGVINTDLLKSCFGASADHYPTPDEWSYSAAQMMLSLSERDNGQSLSIGH